MEAVRVDENGSVQLKVLIPGAYYEPEIIGPDEIKLRRVYPTSMKKISRDEALKAIEASPLRFIKSWGQLKDETRE